MRKIRLITWALIAIIVSVSGIVYLNQKPNPVNKVEINMGSKFDLLRHDGQPINERDLLGKPHAMFFGFTTCPEVCPTTLFEISTWLEALGTDSEKIDVYFMSVDPERDTVAAMAQYLSSFDGNIVGITGSQKDIKQVLRSFSVYAKKVILADGNYTMDHTASIFLFDAKGKFVRTISYGEDTQTAIAKLRKMIN